MAKNNKLIFLSSLIILSLIAIIISIITTINLNKIETNDNKEEKINKIKDDIIEDTNIDNTEYFKDKNLLVQKTYFKEDTTLGTFILTDGTIYTYETSASDIKKGDSLESMIENSKRLNINVTEEELNLLKEDINNLDNKLDYTKSDTKYDYQMLIQVYTSKRALLLKSEGVQGAENKTKEGQELLKIINNYLE